MCITIVCLLFRFSTASTLEKHSSFFYGAIISKHTHTYSEATRDVTDRNASFFYYCFSH